MTNDGVGRRRAWAVAVAFACCVVSQTAEAQPRTGYEIALSGATTATYGERFRAAGTAYAVVGLADLVPLPSSDVEAEIRTWDANRNEWVSVVSGRFGTDRAGRFLVDLLVPAQPISSAQLRLVVGRRGHEGGRELTFAIAPQSPHELTLLTDRHRYEAGETIHAFVRATVRSSGAPVVEGAVHVVVRDPSGRVVVERDVATRRSGTISLDALLPETSPDGRYSVSAELRAPVGSVAASRAIEVGRRTVERLLVTPTLERDVVAPGGVLAGSVAVRTPSGAPIVGASVDVTVPGGATLHFVSDDTGAARFRVSAPMYLSGDFETQSLSIRVTHPAHGALHVSAPYVLSRTEVRVEVVAENGALVPEVPTRVLLHATNVRGEALPEGTRIDVSGPGVERGTARVTTDARGFAIVPMRVANGQAGRIEEAGACQGSVGIRFQAIVQARRAFRAELCARVAREARVRVRVAEAIVAKGARVDVEIARRPSSSSPVLVEALAGGVPVAAEWIEPSTTRGTIVLPEDLEGLVLVRARPFGGLEARRPNDQEGGVAFGVGSLEALLVRPRDAFSLSLEGREEPYPVGGTATVGLRSTSETTQAYATVVARDLAQHGGEIDYAMRWLAAFDSEITRPDLANGSSLVRAALAATLTEDPAVHGVAPLVAPPWDSGEHGDASAAMYRGELRDPVRLRDELLRRGIAQVMVALEAAVEASLGTDDTRVVDRRGGRRGFAPTAILALVDDGAISEEQAATLGGERMSLAMLESADPSFRFDVVAARIARRKLVRLLDVLLAFTNPDDENAQRASASLPPERWLSHLVTLGVIAPEELLDPWGHSFVYHRSGSPRLVVSQRAPDFELVSPGPDGRVGTADDVRDPFRRLVPEGTPYAVASGEDDLLRALSTIAPGESTLVAMLAAYRSMSLAASEEQRGPIVAASASEAYDEREAAPAAAMGFGSLGTVGRGMGGGGMGYGSGMMRAQAVAAPAAAAPAEPESPSAAGSTLERVGERIRERFPATLFFAGEIPLAGSLTSVSIPLADALTTYRVEAIAWTDSGFVTSARTEIRVDQEATVDAPIPPFATIGDVLRVPVRVANRGSAPLVAKIGLAVEGAFAEAGGIETIEVPPHDAREVTVTIRATAVGEGAIVVRAVRASDGSPLDATRRPFRVFEDARVVRETRRFLAEGRTPLAITIPAEASSRGPGALRVVTGMEFFGALPRGNAVERARTAWAFAFAGRAIEAPARSELAAALHTGVEGQIDNLLANDVRVLASIAWSGDGTELARLVGAGWNASEVGDEDLGRALERLSVSLPERGERPSPDEATAVRDATVLLLLSPSKHGLERPSIASDRDRLIARLRTVVGAETARLPDSVLVAVTGAAALATTRERADDPRAKEMLRRLARKEIVVGNATFLELPEQYGQPNAREWPTSLLAIAHLGLGDRASAFACLRGLSHRSEGSTLSSVDARTLAAAAIGTLTPASSSPLTLTLDGRQVATTSEGGVLGATLEGIDRPGTHELVVDAGDGALAFLELDLRYGLPWSVPETAPLRVDLAIEGPASARDTRAGLSLTVRNRTPRTLVRPIAEIDLPAGTELDEPTRQALASLLRAPATMEGRTLRLPLRSLAPGAFVRIPLPLRFSVSGTVRGLGAVVYDEAGAATSRPRVALTRTRVLTISDRGTEPVAPSPDASPPPIEPRPVPLPLVTPLAPSFEVRP